MVAAQVIYQRPSVPPKKKPQIRRPNGRSKVHTFIAEKPQAEALCASSASDEKKREPCLLRQRPRTPLKVRDDLSHLNAAMFQEDSCPSVHSPCSMKQAPHSTKNCAAGDLACGSPCACNTPASSMPPVQIYQARQPFPTQGAEDDLHRLTCVSQQATDRITVIPSQLSRTGSSALSASRCGSVPLTPRKQQSSGPSLNCPEQGQKHSNANSRRSVPVQNVHQSLRQTALVTPRVGIRASTYTGTFCVKSEISDSYKKTSAEVCSYARGHTIPGTIVAERTTSSVEHQVADKNQTQFVVHGRARTHDPVLAPSANAEIEEADALTHNIRRQRPARDTCLQSSFSAGLPPNLVSQAQDLFIQHAEPCSSNDHDSSGEGKLGLDGFSQILCDLTGIDNPEELPQHLLQRFPCATNQADQVIGFNDFLLWFCRYGFSETILCPKKQRDLRDLARKHGLTVPEIELYKSSFDSFDEDCSGEIEFDEFEKLLRALMKFPSHIQFPPQRLRQFWFEMDVDQSGSIGFEEFVIFYNKYFGRGSDEPAESFYRSVRPCAFHRRERDACTDRAPT